MNPRDLRRYKRCLGCGKQCVLPPRRKCNGCRRSQAYDITTLSPSRKGARARNTSLTRPDKNRTKRAKGQRVPQPPPGTHTNQKLWR